MTLYKTGQRVQCIVEKIYPFGVFVRLGHNNGAKGYIRRRDMDWDRLKSTSELVKIGDEFQAEIVEIPTSRHQKIRLSRLPLLEDPWEKFFNSHKIGDVVEGVVYGFNDRGAMIQLKEKVMGYIEFTEIGGIAKSNPEEAIWPEDVMEGVIISFDTSRKRVNISVQKRIQQLQRASALMYSFATTESQDIAPIHKNTRKKQLFILEDSQALSQHLEEQVRAHGFEVVVLNSLYEAHKRVEQQCDDIFLIDLNINSETSLELIHMIEHLCRSATVIVMSDPDSLQQYADTMERIGVNAVIEKPLDWEELEQLLERSAAGKLDESLKFKMLEEEEGDNYEDSRYLVSGLIEEEWNSEIRLREELKRLVKMTKAKSGFIFYINPVNKRCQIIAEAGDIHINLGSIPQLAHSPVNDVIERGAIIFEEEMPDYLLGRFEKLLEIITFESCIGVPITSQGQRHHALFLFHTNKNAFNRYHVRDAEAMALLLSALLEQDALRQRVQSMGPLLLSGQMASSLTHELSNKSQTFDLVSSKVSYEVKKILSNLSSEVIDGEQRTRLIKLLDELSMMSTDIRETVTLFQKLRHAPKQEQFSVIEVIDEAARFLKTEFNRNNIQFHWVPPKNTYFVSGKRLWLYQAMLNILLNAVQQMSSLPRTRTREISVTITPTTNYKFHIRISDTGPGIHKRLWKRVFRFGFTTRPKGAGLGLYIANNLINSMHGNISVEKSTIGVGTTFLIELPQWRI